jgi:hypothetical protein
VNMPLLSQQAEDSCRLVWFAVAAHERAAHLVRVDDKSASRWGADATSSSALSAISEIVTHVEVFVVESFTEHARVIVEKAPQPIPDIVMATVSKSVESNWTERRNFLKSWLGVESNAVPWWRSWNGFVEARNAWAHGLGRLTSRQRKNQEAVANIQVAGLDLRSSQIFAREDDVRRCATVAVEVVQWIDGRVTRD